MAVVGGGMSLIAARERGIWQKALLSHPMAQVTDLFGGESAFRGPQLELNVPKSLEHLAEPSEVFLPVEENTIISSR